MSQPTQPKQRIQSLDVLRGFALLGILVMNIQGFAMPAAAYFNPAAYGDLTGANRWVWSLSHLFTDLKMMNIFSMLYGAGIILLTTRLEAGDANVKSIHYTRTFWLLVIGLCHAYLLWIGDILVAYAVCAAVVFWARKWKPRTLLIVGIITLSIASLLSAGTQLSLPFMTDADVSGLVDDWLPSAAHMANEIEIYQNGWLAQMEARVPGSIEMNTVAMLFYMFWRAAGLMLLGMALYKWGIFSAERSNRFYTIMMIGGFAIGLPLIAWGIQLNFANEWAFEFSRFGLGWQINYWASILVSLAYIAAVNLIVKQGWLTGLTNRLAAVGRMALTNYIMHTVICTTIFYGHGFGQFGQVERVGQIAIVFAVWLLQLIISPLWMARFRFGPLEWLWRSLTYRKLQPMRRAAAV